MGKADSAAPISEAPFVVILGITQDGGLPHAACRRACCEAAWENPRLRVPTACLGVVLPSTGDYWLIDATPDFPQQLVQLQRIADEAAGFVSWGSSARLKGIFLTHAHVGHYAGLIHLGREVMGAREAPVYAMPRMAAFLRMNGPWNQLVELQNIVIHKLAADEPCRLEPSGESATPSEAPPAESIRLTPILVPHRDEYSETVGFRITGPSRSILYVPDIDKWERWDGSLQEEVRSVDVALIDGTFFAEGELPGRDMSTVPHPFIVETLKRLETLSTADRAKVYFIHLNHTNPALIDDSEARRRIEREGCRVAQVGQRFAL